MARNRKRAKERRARRPQPSGTPAKPGLATARVTHDDDAHDDEATPGPIEHATPDVELAEAQMALGRPELTGEPAPPQPEPELAADDDFGSGVGGEDDATAGSADWDGSGGELAATGARHPEPAGHAGNRLINFIQGSWRELQRVQWPDRRQVMQATGVVLGFVIVAGAYLGVADALAGKIVDFILK